MVTPPVESMEAIRRLLADDKVGLDALHLQQLTHDRHTSAQERRDDGQRQGRPDGTAQRRCHLVDAGAGLSRRKVRQRRVVEGVA